MKEEFNVDEKALKIPFELICELLSLFYALRLFLTSLIIMKPPKFQIKNFRGKIEEFRDPECEKSISVLTENLVELYIRNQNGNLNVCIFNCLIMKLLFNQI